MFTTFTYAAGMLAYLVQFAMRDNVVAHAVF